MDRVAARAAALQAGALCGGGVRCMDRVALPGGALCRVEHVALRWKGLSVWCHLVEFCKLLKLKSLQEMSRDKVLTCLRGPVELVG